MKRTIKLRCIKDQHLVDFVDSGITRDGEPTGQRQALTRILGKRVEVDGKLLPIFLVAEVGAWEMRPGERMPEGDEWQRYEEDVIRREHPEHLIKRWEAAHDRFVSASIERRRQAEIQVEQQTGAEVAKGIQSMVKALSQQASPMPQSKGGNRV